MPALLLFFFFFEQGPNYTKLLLPQGTLSFHTKGSYSWLFVSRESGNIVCWEHRLTVLCTGESSAVVDTSYVMSSLPLSGHCVENSRPWQLPYISCSLEIVVPLQTLKPTNACFLRDCLVIHSV